MESSYCSKDAPIPECHELDSIGASLDILAGDIDACSVEEETIPQTLPDSVSPGPMNGNLHRRTEHTDHIIIPKTDHPMEKAKRKKILPRNLRQKIRDVYCVILCALGIFLIIALIFGLAIFFAGRHSASSRQRDYALSPGVFTSVHGSMKAVGGPFSNYDKSLQDRSSLLYIYTTASFTFQIKNIFSESSLFGEVFSGTDIEYYSNGSLVIHFTIKMETSVSPTYDLVEDMTSLIKSAVDQHGHFGVFTVDLTSLFLYVTEDVINTSQPRVVPEPTNSIPPHCEPIIFPICNHAPYNMTSYPSLIGHRSQIQAFEVGIQHWTDLDSVCHEHLHLFWCVLFTPPCREGESIPPCKEMCQDIEKQCGNSLRILRLLPREGCASLPSEKSGICYSAPILDTPVCEESSHANCPGFYGKKTTLLPNLIGHQSQQWANIFIQKDLTQLVAFGCFQHIRLFGCALLSPPCAPGGNPEFPSPVPPCRELCVAAKHHCGFFMELIRADWALGVNCSQFPAFSNGADRQNTNRCLGGSEVFFPDERVCEGHMCDEERCIPSEWLCDGKADCRDKTDEQKCAQCPGRRPYSCDNGMCLDSSLVCDGVDDCSDGEDEIGCVRLSGNGESEGIVEVYNGFDQEWLPVCSLGWSQTLSDSICHILVGSASRQTSLVPDIRISRETTLIINSAAGMKYSRSQCSSRKVVEISCNVRECGSVARAVHSRAGADDELPATTPWLVLLQGGPSKTFYCGGTIIAESWVLTAAHCVASLTSTSGLRVVAGQVRRGSNSPYSQERKIAEVHVHAEFDLKSLVNDIALLKTSSPFNLNKHVRIICLADTDENTTDDEICVLSGWGKRKHTDKYYRHEAEIRRAHIVPTDQCMRLYENLQHYPFQLSEKSVCARGCDTADTCAGDSGSGLTCWDPGSEHWVVRGVMSWGATHCGDPSRPGVYVGISHFREWIDFVTI